MATQTSAGRAPFALASTERERLRRALGQAVRRARSRGGEALAAVSVAMVQG
jgi:hypothetical protein